MNNFLNTVFLNNTIRDYLIVAFVILVAIILKRFLSTHIASWLFRIAQKGARGIEKKNFIDLVVAPMQIFLVILVTIVAIEKLNYPRILDFTLYKISARRIIEILSLSILFIAFIWLLLRVIDFVAMILEQRANLTPDQSDNQLILFFKDLFKVVIVVFGILLILKFAFNYKISSMVTGLSIVTAAIALATRESLENLIASFIIFFDRPFTTGDLVRVQNITGTVEKIGLRSTRIRTDQKTFVSVPNKQMVDSIMDNLSLRTQRGASLHLEISSETSHDTVTQFVGIVENILLHRKDKIENYTVFLSDINKNAFVVFVEFFTATIPIADFNKIRQEINLAVIQVMEDMNIKLAAKEPEVLVPK